MHADFHGENYFEGNFYSRFNFRWCKRSSPLDIWHCIMILCLLFCESNSCLRQFHRQLWQIQFLHGCIEKQYIICLDLCVCGGEGGEGGGLRANIYPLLPPPPLPRSTAMIQTSVYNKPSIESTTVNLPYATTGLGRRCPACPHNNNIIITVGTPGLTQRE